MVIQTETGRSTTAILNFIRREAGIWVGLFPNRFIIYKEADRNQFDGSTYDGVILATGAKPAITPVKGSKKFYWTEFLSEENLPENETILVIGGGLIGAEIASKLVDKNNHVNIVEMLDEKARGIEMIERKLTMKKLNLRKVETYTNYRVKEIRDDNIINEGNEEKKLKGVDKIVVAVGMQSYNPLQKELKDKFPVYVIGDARKVGKAQTAIKEAYQTAKDL